MSVEAREIAYPVIRQLVGIRRQRGLTQQQVADAAGLRRDHLGRVERGQVEPRLSFVVRYARAVGVRLTAEVLEVAS